jgi:predicted RNase H-like HicB family nuclease
MKYKNTLNKGSVRYIIFKEDGVWYGVALEFNIVEEGDNPVEVMASLFQAIEGYVETAQKLKLRPMPLNQKPAREYEDMWDNLQENKEEDTKIEQVYSFGCAPFRTPALV